MPRIGANIDLSGATGAPAFAWSIPIQSYGNVTMASNIKPSGGTSQWTLAGRGAQTITNNGVTWQNATRLNVSAATGSCTWQDVMTMAVSASPSFISAVTGTMDLGSFNHTVGQISSSSGATINLNTSNVTLNSSAVGSVLSINAGTTINATNSIITIPTGTTARTFGGGGKSYGQVNVTAGTGAITVTGANTFTKLWQVTGGAQSIVWPGSATTTFSAGGNFGNGSNTLTFTPSAGSATLSFAGLVSADHLSLTNIVAANFTLAYAGANSTDGGGNTNWAFRVPPVTSGNFLAFI